jgi:hypothetical protein
VTEARRWRRLDPPALEDFAEDGQVFQGRVQVDEAVPWSAEYRIVFDEQWNTLETSVSVQRAGRSRRLQLGRESSGRWLADDCEVEACRGALDVDLGVTPSTNTSAIRRLGLAMGASAELTATWVRFPDLTVQPLPQRYTRLGERTYLYESLRDGVVVFRARLEVDGTGLVERYEGLFERVD